MGQSYVKEPLWHECTDPVILLEQTYWAVYVNGLCVFPYNIHVSDVINQFARKGYHVVGQSATSYGETKTTWTLEKTK